MSQRWKNWSTSVNYSPDTIAFPTTEEEIRQLIQQARSEGKVIRVVGAGHSFSPLVDQANILVSLDEMSGLIEVDTAKGSATVWAGTRLKALGDLLHQHGLAMENLGDIDTQSIAGAISTGTHGTGIRLGTISTQVTALTIVTGTGEILSCSPTENPTYFKAAQVSLGSLGIITRITLQLIPAYKLKYTSAKAKLPNVLAQLDDLNRQNLNFEFYWFPYTEIVQTKIMNKTNAPPQKAGIGKWLNDIVLENGVFWVLSKISRFIPGTSIAVSKISGWGVSGSRNTAWSHQVFATPRYVKFQEMEYNVPAEHFKAVLLEIQQLILQQKFRVHFPIECRWVKGDDIWLSPAYQRESAYIAVHMYKGMAYRAYFDGIEAIFKKYNGRPHWGKMNTQTYQEAARNYPKWKEFTTVRNTLDPKGLFLNPYLKAIFQEK